jgi:hypothetical protein
MSSSAPSALISESTYCLVLLKKKNFVPLSDSEINARGDVDAQEGEDSKGEEEGRRRRGGEGGGGGGGGGEEEEEEDEEGFSRRI